MSISSENRKSGPFLGTGAVSEYPFDFTVFGAEDLLVIVADETGADTTLVLDSDYTVDVNADQDSSPGGTVVLAAPLAADHLLVITSDIAALQPADLTNQGGFYPEVVNTALDRLTILIQQLKEQVSRSLKVSITSTEEATPDALAAEMDAAVVAATAASVAAEAASVAAAASAAAAAAFDPDSMGTLTLQDSSYIRQDLMRFTVPLNPGQFQTSWSNSSTNVGARPSGTGTSSSWFARNGSASEYLASGMTATYGEIKVSKDASEFGDSYRPLNFNVGNAKRMSIENDGKVIVDGGNVLFGASAYPANVTSGLYVVNGVSAGGFRSHAGTAGSFTADAWNLHWNGSAMALWVGTTNVGNLTITSDYRIKRDVQDMAGDALARVARLRPVSYRHTAAPELEFTPADDAQREGFIAHELAEVVPSAVIGEKDAPNQIQSLRLDPLVALLVRAVQQQQEQIDSLRQQINGGQQ